MIANISALHNKSRKGAVRTPQGHTPHHKDDVLLQNLIQEDEDQNIFHSHWADDHDDVCTLISYSGNEHRNAVTV